MPLLKKFRSHILKLRYNPVSFNRSKLKENIMFNTIGNFLSSTVRGASLAIDPCFSISGVHTFGNNVGQVHNAKKAASEEAAVTNSNLNLNDMESLEFPKDMDFSQTQDFVKRYNSEVERRKKAAEATAEKKLKKKAKELEEAVSAGKVSLTDFFNDLRETINESMTTIKTGLKADHEEVTDVVAKDTDSEKVTEVTAQEPAPQAAAEAQAQSVQLDPQALLNAMSIEQKREMLEALMSVDYTAAPAPAPVTVVNTDETGTASPEALKALAESVNGNKRKNRNQ